ncbi:MAG: UDP-3-O-(3-hydroxymyristoyl)glucosamine N-acyltransferase [Planctomycetes bacterium RBG_13_63_9]|nr:MAG: UDP-3-O-(3-hydroxymyristoyl)glucosamine N-acyltransferase [Planctomycetes bacterium RBG_13_63_9]
MQATLAELATLIDGALIGDGDLMISGAASLRDAGPGEITLVDGSEKSRELAACLAAAVIAPKTFVPEDRPAIQVDDVHRAFAAIIIFFHPPRQTNRLGISPLAVISPTAELGDDVDVHPFATIGDEVTIGAGSTIHAGAHIMAGSRIGRDVTIFPNAVLYEGTVVGPRCVIHAGAVLGAYGFGYSFVDNRHQLSAQLGNVVLGAEVEIGAGTTIDRGTYGPTVVGEGTKIDDLVMVAHNCRIGRHNMLCSQVGIAGSTTTGDYVVMAGQVGVRDHVNIGNGAVLGAMAGVSNDVPDGSRMIGIPATPEREQKLKQAALSRLPELRRQVKKLQRTVDALVQESATGQDAPAQTDDPEDARSAA